jgi:hypothetical protein
MGEKSALISPASSVQTACQGFGGRFRRWRRGFTKWLVLVTEAARCWLQQELGRVDDALRDVGHLQALVHGRLAQPRVGLGLGDLAPPASAGPWRGR